MHTHWSIQSQSPPEGDRALAGGEYVLQQRLLPSGLAELQTGIDLPKEGISLSAGSQLIEVKTNGVAIFCQPSIQAPKLIGHAQLCLVDSNNDDAFDGFFKTTSMTKGILTIQGNRPKQPKAIEATRFARVTPSSFKEQYFVAIERRNYFNIYGRESFMIVFGREGDLDRITSPIQFNSSDFPKDINILGSHFTALTENEGKMIVRVHSAMPEQPFGIMTYRVYR